MAITKISDLNGLYNQIYEDTRFASRDNNLLLQLVSVYPAQSGYATRTESVWGTATVAVVGEGVDFVTNDVFAKAQLATFTPTKKMTQFLFTDEMAETESSREFYARKASNEMGEAMAEYVDKDLIGVFASFTNSKGAAGSALTKNICAAAQVAVRRDNGKGRGNFVLAPEHWHDIWVELGSPAATMAWQGDYANQALRDYYVGNMIGADWFQTNNIEIDGDSDAVSAFFLRDAIGYDPRKVLTFEPERDASRTATELNAHIGYAVGVIYADHGCKITADATEPA